MDINDLRQARADALEDMEAKQAAIAELEAADERDDEAIAAAEKAFDATEAAFNEADQKVKRAERVEAAKASAAIKPANPVAPVAAPGAVAHAAPKNPEDKGMEAGLFVLAMAATDCDIDKAAKFAEEKLGASGISASLSGLTPAGGGVLIPEAYSGDLIELLRARAVVRRAGARIVDMPAGNMRDSRQTGAASAAYGAELGEIALSEPTFERVDKTFKKLTSLVPISNSLIRHASHSVAGHVRDDMLKQMALREDLAFLRDDGTGEAPKGLRHWALPGNVFSPTSANVPAFLRQAVNLVEEGNVAMAKPAWIMRPAIKNFLAEYRDANGNKVFPEIDGQNQLHGYPIFTTTQIPNNLGIGGDETEITFADFDEIVIGDAMRIEISVSTEATIYDGGGNPISLFQTDQTAIRAIAEHDMVPRHDEAISVIEAVDWSLG